MLNYKILNAYETVKRIEKNEKHGGCIGICDTANSEEHKSDF
jgi:hypothetical protein